MNFETKDSGKRQEYVSGMRRDIQTGKPRFDLLLTFGQPYSEQFITRLAALLERGSIKYGERNWQLANSSEELERFRASALRHITQWACGEADEDHAAATAFNLMAFEYVKWKMENEAVQVSDTDSSRSEDSSGGNPDKLSWAFPKWNG